MTNAHLTDYRPGADIQITRGSKYRDVIAPSSHILSDAVSKQRYVVCGLNNEDRRRRRRRRR